MKNLLIVLAIPVMFSSTVFTIDYLTDQPEPTYSPTHKPYHQTRVAV